MSTARAGHRLPGLLVVGLVLAAVVVVAGLQARTVAGTAVLGRVPGAPLVGQCLLEAPPPRGGDTPLRLGGCSKLHYGEVAAVLGANGPADPADSCTDQDDFLGWQPLDLTASHASWHPVDIPVTALVPTALQRSFGQHWLACVVTPLVSGSSYAGSVRGVLATGRVPAAFAECTAGLYVPMGPISCLEPHPYELFGRAQLPDTFQDQSGLDADCRLIVSAATRMPDVTAGGELDVRAVPFHENSTGITVPGLPDGPSDVRAQTVCLVGVTGDRLLTASLHGLGSAPLPWA